MTEQFSYPFPFGAQLQEDGSVLFRIWAPNQKGMSVVNPDSSAREDMQPEDGGWFRLATRAFGAGDAYVYALPDGRRVPDPASRCQRDDVDGPSLVVDPRAYRWRNAAWLGRPWEEAVLYELHVGTFSPEGTFDGLRRRLGHFVDAGFTAIELMPVADFSGTRGWGYDGVMPYAPDRAYGSPDDLKQLIDEAHGLGLMVFLDVVYNHFGPVGNYLHAYAEAFFDDARKTPWGAGIDYTQRPVRDFFLHNAAYWLEEYRFDGLRFDAVDQIVDPSDTHFLVEMAAYIRQRITDRHVHLVLENDQNQALLLQRDPAMNPRLYSAQWNDDYHHVVHAQLTNETDGYYEDYSDDRLARIGRALATGFVYQGEKSPFRGGRIRGEPSAHLPPSAFVNFIQNHDQIGNRAFGDRLAALAEPQAVEAALCLLLLAPQVPLMFMGEEWGETRPFCFFCDFHDELADAVREGRRSEFSRFARFQSEEAREKIPDPNALATFEQSKLDWEKARDGGPHQARLGLVRELLAVRAREIAPLARDIGPNAGSFEVAGNVLRVAWQTQRGTLVLLANLSDSPASRPPQSGRNLYAVPGQAGIGDTLPPWAVVWTLAEGGSE
ncbi:malto-oligosyltrehalose trehalohydrolase [Rhodoligotrophos defluvii]|uniref:malto-oligosyltrehalose trehalohydrolase n=1 Tax=Rhodoligotrophos defluvii TaxID=2561934 RepID=UPI0010C9684A|nr:malto-oligosyltrehalose trehalohydrolase [Rhodoligotrophos defluvii]